LNRWEVLFRLVILLLILTSLAMAWWSFTRRLVPLQKQSRDVAVQLSRFASEVDTLERKWSRTETDQIRSEYTTVRSQLFADLPEIGRWLMRLDEQAAPLALEIKVDFGKSSSRSAEEEQLAVIPASIVLEVHPTIGGTQTPYQRMLRLGQQLGAEGKRADLFELSVNGGPLSITHGLLVFNLWCGELGK
jgi:hypothetical protein